MKITKSAKKVLKNGAVVHFGWFWIEYYDDIKEYKVWHDTELKFSSSKFKNIVKYFRKVGL